MAGYLGPVGNVPVDYLNEEKKESRWEVSLLTALIISVAAGALVAVGACFGLLALTGDLDFAVSLGSFIGIAVSAIALYYIPTKGSSDPEDNPKVQDRNRDLNRNQEEPPFRRVERERVERERVPFQQEQEPYADAQERLRDAQRRLDETRARGKIQIEETRRAFEEKKRENARVLEEKKAQNAREFEEKTLKLERKKDEQDPEAAKLDVEFAKNIARTKASLEEVKQQQKEKNQARIQKVTELYEQQKSGQEKVIKRLEEFVREAEAKLNSIPVNLEITPENIQKREKVQQELDEFQEQLESGRATLLEPI